MKNARYGKNSAALRILTPAQHEPSRLFVLAGLSFLQNLNSMNTVADTIETDERGLLLTCPHCSKRNRMAYERLGQTFRCGQCHTELPPTAEPVEINSETAFNGLIGRSPWPVLVDFWASWCGPCKMLAPELIKIAGEGAGRWLISKVSTEELPALAQRFRISSIPTLALFKSGREVARQGGAMPAAAIRQFIQQAG
jgi:thioredoxin 2